MPLPQKMHKLRLNEDTLQTSAVRLDSVVVRRTPKILLNPRQMIWKFIDVNGKSTTGIGQ